VKPNPTAGEYFQRWMATEMQPWLKERGWRRRGSLFLRRADPNTAVIEFLRGKWSQADDYMFRIEAAVYSPRLAEEHSRYLEMDPPTRPMMHFGTVQHLLSSLMGENFDLWWHVRAPSLTLELAALGENVREKLETYVFPWIEAHCSDEQIRDYFWTFRDDLGGISLRQLRRLLIDLGPVERVPEVDQLIEEWPAKRTALTAQVEYELKHYLDEDAAEADAAMERLAMARD